MRRRLGFRSWINVILAVVVIGVGIGATRAVAADNPNSSSARTATVQKGTVLSSVSASGNVQAKTTSDLTFSSGGTISEVNVSVGQHVSKGDVIAKVDTVSAQASLDAAKLNLTAAQEKLSQARAAVTESQRLADQATIQQAQDKVDTAQRTLDSADEAKKEQAQADLDSAKRSLASTKAQIEAKHKQDPAQVASSQASVVTAQANVTSAQKSLDETTLTAPFSGTITAVNKKVGDSAGGSSGSATTSNTGTSTTTGTGTSTASTSTSSQSSGSAVVTLTDLSSLEIKAGFAESNVGKLKVGQTVNISYDALTDENATGTIDRIDSSSTTVNNVVTYYVYATINGPSEAVRPGMTATAQVVVDSRSNVLYLSNSAVTASTDNTATVQVVKDGTTTPASVTTGLKGDDSTEIVSGLSQGDRVEIASTSSTGSGFPNLGGLGGGGPGGGFGGGGPPGGAR